MMPSGICYNLNHLLFRNKRWIKYLGSFSPFILTSKYTPLLFFTCVLFFFCIEFIDALFKSFKKLKKNQPSLIQILMVLIIIYSFSILTWSFNFNSLRSTIKGMRACVNKKKPWNLDFMGFSSFLKWCEERDLNPHWKHFQQAPQTCASANSAILAYLSLHTTRFIIPILTSFCKYFLKILPLFL